MLKHLKIQYFMTFFVLGCLLPYMPVYLQSLGFDKQQIGDILATAGVAIVVTPVLMALLADRVMSGRVLLVMAFSLAAVALLLMLQASQFWFVLMLFTAFNLVFMPTLTLQDGLNFSEQHRRQAAGEPQVKYHRIRVFGTFGFIFPGLLLYALLHFGLPVSVSIITAMVACGVGALNASRLPGIAPERVLQTTGDDPLVERKPVSLRTAASSLPTLVAARAMLQRPVLVYCIAMFLMHMSIAVYYSFYPLYLTQLLDIDTRWIGLIMAIGVVMEIGYMLGFGWLVNRMGIKRLIILGLVTQAVRMGLLAWWVNLPVALGVHLLHGMVVLVVHVAPPIYLNHHASQRFRNSMQGLFTMLVVGVGRIVGNAFGGRMAQISLETAFAYAVALALAGAVLVLFAFKDVKLDEQ